MATASSPAVPVVQTQQSTILTSNWAGSALKTELTFHQLSPYIGKLKSSIAGSLISQFTDVNDLIYDPFSGSGTVALEAWAAGRNIVANDLSPYAAVLTRAKLFPYPTLELALRDIETLVDESKRECALIDLRNVPPMGSQILSHRDSSRSNCLGPNPEAPTQMVLARLSSRNSSSPTARISIVPEQPHGAVSPAEIFSARRFPRTLCLSFLAR